MSNSRRPKPKNQVFLLTCSVSILNCQRAGELSYVNVEKTEIWFTRCDGPTNSKESGRKIQVSRRTLTTGNIFKLTIGH